MTERPPKPPGQILPYCHASHGWKCVQDTDDPHCLMCGASGERFDTGPDHLYCDSICRAEAIRSGEYAPTNAQAAMPLGPANGVGPA